MAQRDCRSDDWSGHGSHRRLRSAVGSLSTVNSAGQGRDGASPGTIVHRRHAGPRGSSTDCDTAMVVVSVDRARRMRSTGRRLLRTETWSGAEEPSRRACVPEGPVRRLHRARLCQPHTRWLRHIAARCTVTANLVMVGKSGRDDSGKQKPRPLATKRRCKRRTKRWGRQTTGSCLLPPKHRRAGWIGAGDPPPCNPKHHPATTRMAWRSRGRVPCEAHSMRVPGRHARSAPLHVPSATPDTPQAAWAGLPQVAGPVGCMDRRSAAYHRPQRLSMSLADGLRVAGRGAPLHGVHGCRM